MFGTAQILRFVSKSGILTVLPSYTGNRKEVNGLTTILVSFFVSVAAGIACYYICKWLDRHSRGS